MTRRDADSGSAAPGSHSLETAITGTTADFMPGLVGEDGVIRGPGSDGRMAVVAQDDIADAAAAVLADPSATPAIPTR